MNKRDFAKATTGVAIYSALAGLPLQSAAQHKLRPGKGYRLLTPPQRTQAPAGKIEVIEFFWVGCPHCRRMEPTIHAWEKKQSSDVFFRKVHVNFRTPTHQQLYYTLVALDAQDRLIDSVFSTIHDQRNRLNTPDKVFDWAQSQGLNRKDFMNAYKSFGVRTSMRQASQEVKANGTDSVPALTVNGKYYTAPSMAGSNQAAMDIVDKLIERERNG